MIPQVKLDGKADEKGKENRDRSSEMDDSLVGEILTKSIPVDLNRKTTSLIWMEGLVVRNIC